MKYIKKYEMKCGGVVSLGEESRSHRRAPAEAPRLLELLDRWSQPVQCLGPVGPTGSLSWFACRFGGWVPQVIRSVFKLEMKAVLSFGMAGA